MSERTESAEAPEAAQAPNPDQGDGPWPNGMPYTVQFPGEDGGAADLEHPAPLPRVGDLVEYIDETGRDPPLSGPRGRAHPADHGRAPPACRRRSGLTPGHRSLWPTGMRQSSPARAASCEPACQRLSSRRLTSLQPASSTGWA